jgi:hypothetical protein
MTTKNSKKPSKIQEFWNYFAQHEATIIDQDFPDAQVVTEMLSLLGLFDYPVLTEFGPPSATARRQLILSADGDKRAFPLIEKIVAQAPPFERWEILAFRQPKPGVTDITLGSLHVQLSEVYFKHQRTQNKIALELHLKDYVDNAEYNITSFILLDLMIGEYDAETMLGAITRRKLNPELTEDLKPLALLPKVLAQHKREVFGLN